jgi:hypothetical protein
MIFAPLIPLRYIILVAMVMAALGLAAGLSSGRIALRKTVLLTVLRITGAVAVVLFLLNPCRISEVWKSGAKPSIGFLLDVSDSMATQDCIAESPEKPIARIEGARGILDKASRSVPLAFDVKSAAFSSGEELMRIPEPGSAVKGDKTGIAAVIMRVAAENPTGLRAVFLLTDGIETAGGDIGEAAASARLAGFPVYPVVVGGPVSPPEVEVTVRGTEAAIVGDEAAIETGVKVVNASPCTISLRLMDEEGGVIEERKMDVEGSVTREEAFRVSSNAAGTKLYLVEASSIPGETDLSNNRAIAPVSFIDGKIRVLFLEGAPHWDSRFLGRMLEEDKYVDVTSVIRLSKDRVFVQAGKAEGSDTAMADMSRLLSDFSKFDVVMIGKGPEYFLDEEGVRRLAKFIVDDGGALVLFRPQPLTGELPGFVNIEPVVWEDTVVENAVFSTVPSQRMLWGMPAGGDGVLPPLTLAHNVAQVKAFAEVIATAKGADGETVPAVIVRRFGKGMVVAVNGEGFWKWQFNQSKARDDHRSAFRALWAGMVRWLAVRGEFLPGWRFTLRADRTVLEPGEPVRLTVASLLQIETPPVVELKSPDGSLRAIVPSPSPTVKNTYHSLLSLEKPGYYVASIKGEEAGIAPKVALTVLPGVTEANTLSADTEAMAKLARLTGGGIVRDAAEITRIMNTAAERVAVEREASARSIPAWNLWWLALVVTGVLAGEWFLRRREGMS